MIICLKFLESYSLAAVNEGSQGIEALIERNLVVMKRKFTTLLYKIDKPFLAKGTNVSMPKA